MVHVSEQLIGDHAALDEILKQLQAVVRTSDIEAAHAKLDLFWARLAVHIRAEHLHLFPTVLNGIKDAASKQAPAPLLDEAQTVVTQLRQDHEFFMHQLALAIEIMRELLTLPDHFVGPEGLKNVNKILHEVQERLAKHNQIEEGQVYRWTSLLDSKQQAKLEKQITTELSNHPPRFSLSTWLDE